MLGLMVIALFAANLETGSCQAMGLAMQGELPPQDYMLLDSAVKQIIGPMATATMPMVALALQQGAPPVTLTQLLPYVSMMTNLATQLGVKPPGVKGVATQQQMTDFIMQRAIQWMQQRAAFSAMTGGGGGGGAGAMAAMMGGGGGMNMMALMGMA